MQDIQLVYLSRATSYVDRAELCSIADDSARRNRKNGITGALIYCNGYFLQVLEGPSDIVTALYNKIGHDARHCDVVLLRQTFDFARLFPDWNMASLHEEHMMPDLVKRAVDFVNTVGAAADPILTPESRELLAEIRESLAAETQPRVEKAA